MTLSAYLEVSHCSPVLFSSDLISPLMSTQLTHLLSPLDSWTIASSLLLLPKTSAWSSTPEMQRFPLPVPSGTSLGVDTPKLQTGETSNNNIFSRQLDHVLSTKFTWIEWALLHYSNRVTGIYELSLCKMSDTGSPGEQIKNVVLRDKFTQKWKVCHYVISPMLMEKSGEVHSKTVLQPSPKTTEIDWNFF